LERSRDRYRQLYDHAPTGYLTLGPRGQIQEANLTAARLLGVERAALVDTPLSRRMDQASADLLHTHLQHVISDRQAHTCELGVVRADGKRVWLRLESAPSEEPDDTRGQPCCHTVFSDISERRQLESYLQRAEQIDVIGRLASGVAHEFNNLLMAMLGCASSALIELDETSRAAQLLRDLKAEAIRGSTLTRQLLALGRLGDDTGMIVDINAIAAQNARILRHTLPEDIGLAFKLGAKDGRVWAKHGQIEQVLTNLILNARDAVSEGGSIQVSTSELDLDAERAGGLGLEPGPYVVITVSDTGVGMDEATKSRLFEPFFTTKTVGEGTGLGMSSVYRLIHQASGQIEVESEVGDGTVVRVFLPSQRGSLPSPEHESQVRQLGGDETVLVVEDEGLVRQTVNHYLTRWGYRVLEARDGAEALDIIKAQPDIQLLLTDMVLPGLGGAQLARDAVELRPDLRVLFMSAHPKVKLVRERSLDADAPALQKPFTEDTLIVKVREVLGVAPPPPQTVLLVEDDQLARDALQVLLDDEGYQVLAAGDGAQAMALAREYGELIDVLVSDLGMPDQDGFDLIRQLRAGSLPDNATMPAA
jgi:PAS domain S-box-containing protein